MISLQIINKKLSEIKKTLEFSFKNICDKNMFAENELGKVLAEVEYHNGGEAYTECGHFVVSGDNGMKILSVFELLEMIDEMQ